MIAESINATIKARDLASDEWKATGKGKTELDALGTKLEKLTRLRNAGFRTFEEIADLKVFVPAPVEVPIEEPKPEPVKKTTPRKKVK